MDPKATESSGDDIRSGSEKMTKKSEVLAEVELGPCDLPNPLQSTCVDSKIPEKIKKRKAFKRKRTGDSGQDKLGKIMKQSATRKPETANGDREKLEKINAQLLETGLNLAVGITLPPAAKRTRKRNVRSGSGSQTALDVIGALGRGVVNEGFQWSYKKSKMSDADCCCNLPLRSMNIPGPVPTDLESLRKNVNLCLDFFHDLPEC